MKEISFWLKYPNSHLLPIIQKFTEFSYANKVFYIYDINKERFGYDWEIPSSIKTSKIKWFRDLNAMLKSDIIISWGIWMDWRFFLLILYASYRNKTIFIFSESENQYRLKSWHTLMKYITSFFLNKRNMYFLTMGGYQYVLRDFSKYGFCKKNFLKYGFCGAISSNESSFAVKLKNNIHKPEIRNKLRLLYVGQLIHRKGIDILLNSLCELPKNMYTLNIAGDGELKSNLELLAKKLRIEDNVKFLGHQNSKQLEQLYKMSDIFILPSRFDGWGAVLNEAASFSLPLIASINVRGAEELIKTFENGFVFKDALELKRILIFISNNRFLLKNFSEASLIISKCYSPINLAQRLDSYIKKIFKDNETNNPRS